MGERTKLRYEIDLTSPVPVPDAGNASVRSVTRDDLDRLARVMLDAYVGTIDFEDEDLDDAVDEVRSYLDRGPLLEHSFVAEVGGEMASAVLLSLSDNTPFIGYVMTLPAHKGEGLARLVTTSSMSSLAGDDHRRIVLYITEGNVPSEALFRSVGAIPTPGR
jgi:hypothetical protein